MKTMTNRLMSQLKEPKAKDPKISLSGRAFSVIFNYCAFELWEHTRTDNRQRQTEKHPLEEESICLIEDKDHRNNRKIVTHNTKGIKRIKNPMDNIIFHVSGFLHSVYVGRQKCNLCCIIFLRTDRQLAKTSQKDDFYGSGLLRVWVHHCERRNCMTGIWKPMFGTTVQISRTSFCCNLAQRAFFPNPNSSSVNSTCVHS